MNARLKLAVPLMLATTAALAATGYANRNMSEESIVPTPQSEPYVAPADNAAIAPSAEDSIAAPPAAIESAPAPQQYTGESVTVTAPRPSNDELLRNAVMDRISGDARLSGRVGVEAYRHTVSLTGRVMSDMQVDRAETLARSVDGVWDVNNYLSARVGKS